MPDPANTSLDKILRLPNVALYTPDQTYVRPDPSQPDNIYYLSPGACTRDLGLPNHTPLTRTWVPGDYLGMLNAANLSVCLHGYTPPSVFPARWELSSFYAKLIVDMRITFADNFAFTGTKCHDLCHWLRVVYWGYNIARITPGASVRTVIAFALLHDLFRETDDDDPDHGPRCASQLTGSADGNRILNYLYLSKKERDDLIDAIHYHSYGQVLLEKDDPTIACCWDADRYDLTRDFTIPNLALFSTAAAKRLLWTL